jgi:DNA repair exonuclease SbcCD ATPase subunit
LREEVDQKSKALQSKEQQLALASTSMEGQSAGLQAQVMELESSLAAQSASYKEQILALQSSLTNKTSEYEKQLQSLQTTIDTQAAEYNKQLAALQESLDNQAGEHLKELTALQDSMDAQASEHETQLSALRSSGSSQSAELAQEILSAKTKAAEAEAASSSLKAELVAAQEREQELKNAVEAAKAEAASAAAAASASAASAVAPAESAEDEDTIVSLTEQLEMATVDKELAEGLVEELQMEVAQLKERLQQQQSSGSAGDEVSSSASTGGAAAATTAMDAGVLAEQNEKLKEALLQLKEFSVLQQHEREQLSAKLNHLQSEVLPTLQSTKTSLEEKVLDYEEQMEALKENLDTAKDLQDKFQDLFDSKMDLEEENKELKDTVQDLQALRDLADEVEENHQALEKRLRSELHQKQVEVLDQEGVVKNLQQALQIRAETMERLEAYVNELQLGIQQQQQQQQQADADGSASAVQQQSPQSADLQRMLQEQASRAAAKAIDDELRQVEHETAQLHLNLLRLFVPEAAVKSDMECTHLLLLMRRLSHKSALIVRALQRQFALEQFERMSDTLVNGDTFLYFVWQLSHCVEQFQVHAEHFLGALQTCDEETYLKLGRLQPELAPYEKKLDHLLSLVQREKLDAQYPLDELQVVLDRFAFLSDKLLPKSALQPWRALASLTRRTIYFGRSIVVQCHSLMASSTPAAIPVSINQFKLLLPVCRRFLKTLESRSGLLYQTQLQDDLKQASELFALLYQIVNKVVLKVKPLVAASLADQPAASSPRVNIPDDQLHTLCGDTIEEFSAQLSAFEAALQNALTTVSASGSSAEDDSSSSSSSELPLDSYLNIVHKYLVALDDQVARGTYDDMAASPAKKKDGSSDGYGSVCARLEERAKNLRADLEGTLTIKHEVNALRKEITDRDAALALKVKAIEDLQWKIRKLEHRQTTLETAEKELTDSHAEKERSWVTREKSLEEQLLVLQKSVESLTTANTELSVHVSSGSGTSSTDPTGSGASASSGSSTHYQPHDVEAASPEEVETLHKVITQLRQQIVQLRGADAHNKLSKQLPPLSVRSGTRPTSSTSSSTSAAIGNVSATHRALVHSLALPHVVDLRAGSTLNQLQRTSFDQQRLRSLADKAKAGIAELGLLNRLSVSTDTPTTTTPLLLGRLEVPSTLSTESPVRVSVNQPQFAAIHSVFVK